MEERPQNSDDQAALWTVVIVVAALVLLLLGHAAWMRAKNDEQQVEVRREFHRLEIAHLRQEFRMLDAQGEIRLLRSKIRKLEDPSLPRPARVAPVKAGIRSSGGESP